MFINGVDLYSFEKLEFDGYFEAALNKLVENKFRI
jgi:hypothetical protein